MGNASSVSNALDGSHLQRALGCVAASSLIPLWVSGSLGQALSLGVTLAFLISLIVLSLFVARDRLNGVLRITLVVFATSLSLFSADLALRLVGGSRVYYRAHSEFLRKDTSFPSLTRYVPNAHSTRETFGDLAAISGVPAHRVRREESFLTDEFGFRNSPEKLNAPYDIIILGDSFGMGLSASQDEHWGALLIRQGHSVYNLSMPSTCLAHGAARLSLESNRLSLAPQATIIALVYTGNDLEECSKSVDAILAEGPQSPWRRALTWIEDYRARSPLRQLGMSLVYRFIFSDPVIEARTIPQLGDVLFYKPHDKAARLSRSEVEESQNFSNLKQGLLTVNEIANAHQAHLLVMVVPSKEEIYGWALRGSRPWDGADSSPSGLSQAVRSVCDAHHIRCVDLKPLLIENAKTAFDKGTLLWWRDDSHWNRDGHLVTTRIIEEALRQP